MNKILKWLKGLVIREKVVLITSHIRSLSEKEADYIFQRGYRMGMLEAAGIAQAKAWSSTQGWDMHTAIIIELENNKRRLKYNFNTGTANIN